MTGNCKDCRWWDVAPNPYAPTFRDCLKSEQESSLMRGNESDHSGERFVQTAETFGCVMFEAKG